MYHLRYLKGYKPFLNGKSERQIKKFKKEKRQMSRLENLAIFLSLVLLVVASVYLGMLIQKNPEAITNIGNGVEVAYNNAKVMVTEFFKITFGDLNK